MGRGEGSKASLRTARTGLVASYLVETHRGVRGLSGSWAKGVAAWGRGSG